MYLSSYNTIYKYTNFQIRVFAYTNKKVSEQYKSNGIERDGTGKWECARVR